jgi:hypothetical protein
MGAHRGKFRAPRRQAGGCASKISSPGANVTRGCLLRVQMCRVGRSHDVSSRLPTHADHAVPRQAANPRAALRAHQPRRPDTGWDATRADRVDRFSQQPPHLDDALVGGAQMLLCETRR